MLQQFPLPFAADQTTLLPAEAAGVSGVLAVVAPGQLAVELAPVGVRVNAVSPGFIYSEMTAKALDGLFSRIADEEREIRKNPLGQASALIKKVFGSL